MNMRALPPFEPSRPSRTPAVMLDSDHGEAEVTDEALARMNHTSWRDFERVLLLEARRRSLQIHIHYDFPRNVYVFRWNPAPSPTWVGIWRLV